MVVDSKVLGGEDYTLVELLRWHPYYLAGLILDYQKTRAWWRRADAACGTYVAALEAELRATKRELEGVRAELRHVARMCEQRRAA